jgi:phosphoserine phosphatase RsbU/P
MNTMATPSPHDELLRLAPCGLFSFSAKGMLVAVNDTLLEWLGYRRDELLSRPLATFLTLAGRMFCETHVLPLLRMNGRVQELYLPLRASNGDSLPVLLNAVSQTHEEGTVHHCAVMSVRERGRYEEELLKAKRQAEEALRGNEELAQARRELEEHARNLDQKISQLEQRNRELTRVSALLAQDLREPARKLSMFACLFTREDREGMSLSGQRSLERIKTDSAKLEQLVAGLHQFMTLDTYAEPTEEVDLLEAVGSARMRTAEMRGHLQLRCDPLPVIEGRRRQLMMLFHNLFDNAAKFRRTEESPRIDIQCQIVQHNSFRAMKDRYHYTDFARIIIADNGMGFDNQYKSYVFEVMRKLDAGTPGLGIGLPLCRKVVESHQGTISVDSEPGKGTRFTILLPLKQQHGPVA